MSFEDPNNQQDEQEKNVDSPNVSLEPEPTDVIDTPEPSLEDAHKIVGVRARIQNIFQRTTKEVSEATLEKEQMAETLKILRKIDGKLATAYNSLMDRHKWLGGRFIQGSSLLKGYEQLLQERKSIATENFTHFLERHSLKPISFLKAIENGGPIWKFTDRLQENIQIIEEIEGKMPGACQRLASDYGIQNFSRYPINMLFEQLRSEEDVETPYGIALYSQNDWNGAINKLSNSNLEDLDEKTREVGLRVRIIECNGLIDTAKRLIFLDQKYGEHQKIQFAYVSAHGSEKSIQFGNRSLETESFPENALNKIASFFVEKPTVILHACSTGQEESGIAQMLAQSLDAEVLATPTKPIFFSIESIERVDKEYKFHTAVTSNTPLGMYSKTERAQSFRKQP